MRHSFFFVSMQARPMTRSPSDKPANPVPSEAGRARSDDSREERRAAALRANLTRRKAQNRARQSEPGAEPSPESGAEPARDHRP